MSAINVNKNNFNQEVLNSDKPVLMVPDLRLRFSPCCKEVQRWDFLIS